MQLSKSQSSIVSEYFNDIAKGLFLAAAVNQAIPNIIPLSAKLGLSAVGIASSLLFLYLAISFSTRDEKIW